MGISPKGGFRARENRIDNGLSRQDRMDVLRFWGFLREQDRCFLSFGVCMGTGQDVWKFDAERRC